MANFETGNVGPRELAVLCAPNEHKHQCHVWDGEPNHGWTKCSNTNHDHFGGGLVRYKGTFQTHSFF